MYAVLCRRPSRAGRVLRMFHSSAQLSVLRRSVQQVAPEHQDGNL